MGITYPWSLKELVGRVSALPRVAQRIWIVNVRRSWGSATETRARARAKRLGLLSTVAAARTVHPTLVNRRCTQKCSNLLVPNRTATLTTMLRVHSPVPAPTTPLHFALLLQGNSSSVLSFFHFPCFFCGMILKSYCHDMKLLMLQWLI